MKILNICKNNHLKHLKKIKKISQKPEGINILHKAKRFKKEILKKIKTVKKYIYITVLYFEKDHIGKIILKALYNIKKIKPKLDIKIIVDLHRANRNRIGKNKKFTNSEWYVNISKKYPKINIPIFGVPVNTKEVFGVFHLKGWIFDDLIIYSGASINNIYLHQKKNYRCDRYYMFYNKDLSTSMKFFIDENIVNSIAVKRLDKKITQNNKKLIKKFRKKLKKTSYIFDNTASNKELSVSPIIGLGNRNYLNKTILNLIKSTHKKMILCTPYFNLPNILTHTIINLLKERKKIEIIVGDKISNDFYEKSKKKFKIINILPYLYEINLRKFASNLQKFIDNNQLNIFIWKHGKNSFHSKGIWVDKNWNLITGNNLNLRAWYLDLENAILIHDPNNALKTQKKRTYLY